MHLRGAFYAPPNIWSDCKDTYQAKAVPSCTTASYPVCLEITVRVKAGLVKKGVARPCIHEELVNLLCPGLSGCDW